MQLGYLDVAARTEYLATTANRRARTNPLSDFALKHFSELAAWLEADRVTGAPLA